MYTALQEDGRGRRRTVADASVRALKLAEAGNET
jgi:hypothetical protein